jgi:hypothetical protein
MRYNRSVKVAIGSVVDSTIHIKTAPTEADIADIARLYGSITPGLLTHLEGQFGRVKNNAQFDDLSSQIEIVKFVLKYRGTITLVQPKRSPADERFKTLSELFYDTMVGDLKPNGVKARPDYVFHARPMIRKIAREGGEQYNHALSTIKAACMGEAEYRDAVLAVIPPLK